MYEQLTGDRLACVEASSEGSIISALLEVEVA
jgi:hypothetical protein